MNTISSVLRRGARASSLFCAAAVALVSWATPSAASADYCAFFAGNDWNGASSTYDLPSAGSDSYSGYSWGPVSVRRVGSMIDDAGNPIYDNLETVEIRAMSTDVSLHVYSGSHFDGTFQTIRCKKGSVCRWRYGSMKNNVRSFICQRDAFVDASAGAGALTQVLQNSLVPSYLLADPITAQIHDGVKTQSHRFYSLSLERGRMHWSTSYNLCREVNCPEISEDWRRRYRDYLQYSYRARGKLKADAHNYDMDVKLWIQPRLSSGTLTFLQRGWSVNVSEWIWHELLEDKIADQVKVAYPSIGSQITSSVQSMLRSALGTSLGNTILNGNSRLVFSHPCQYFLQRVGYPDYTFSSYQISNFCGGATPVAVAAPGLRLLK